MFSFLPAEAARFRVSGLAKVVTPPIATAPCMTVAAMRILRKRIKQNAPRHRLKEQSRADLE
jgi:hypothetical protein